MKHRLHTNSYTVPRIPTCPVTFAKCISFSFYYGTVCFLTPTSYASVFRVTRPNPSNNPQINKGKYPEVIVQFRLRPRTHSLSIHSAPFMYTSSTNLRALPAHYFVFNLRTGNKQKEISRREILDLNIWIVQDQFYHTWNYTSFFFWEQMCVSSNTGPLWLYQQLNSGK
jgi:hypothetical protein